MALHGDRFSFTTLIFLDIVAFFDTLAPILSFHKIQNGSLVTLWPDLKEPSHDIERENISTSRNFTRILEMEEGVVLEMVEGELLEMVEVEVLEMR